MTIYVTRSPALILYEHERESRQLRLILSTAAASRLRAEQSSKEFFAARQHNRQGGPSEQIVRRGSALWLGPCAIFVLRLLVLAAFVLSGLIFPAMYAIAGCVPADTAYGTAMVVLDVALWLDVLCAFVTPGWREGEAIRSHRAVALSYLRRPSGLLLDVLIRFPWDSAIASTMTLPSSAGHGSAAGWCLAWGQLSRAALMPKALRIAYTELDGTPRVVPSAARLGILLVSSLIVIHWYACASYLLGRHLLREQARGWLEEQGYEAWPAWERYPRAFNRALLVMIGEGEHGSTGEEICLSTFGALLGLVLIAYVTSCECATGDLTARHEKAALAGTCLGATFCPVLPS